MLIEACRQDDYVDFAITNSGVGLQSPPEAPLNGHGVGLENVQRRLRLHYGDNYSLQISEMDRNHVRVTMVLPLQLSEQPESCITRYGAE